MSNQDKPRICEVLGVEVGEEFKIDGNIGGLVHISNGGHLEDSDGNAVAGAWKLSHIINHPEDIIRKPKFTQDDIELLRHIRSIFGDGRIYRAPNGDLWFSGKDFGYELPRNNLRYIKPGDGMVELKQILQHKN